MISEIVNSEDAPAIYQRLVETPCLPLDIVSASQDRKTQS
jgi:hypothetical protein